MVELITVEVVTWRCRQGHVERQREDCIEVTCGRCRRDPRWRGTYEMRRVDLYPSWGKERAK